MNRVTSCSQGRSEDSLAHRVFLASARRSYVRDSLSSWSPMRHPVSHSLAPAPTSTEAADRAQENRDRPDEERAERTTAESPKCAGVLLLRCNFVVEV